jgi:hypothetical protein
VNGTLRVRGLEAGVTKRLVVRLGREGRARLSSAGPRRARLQVSARDRYGNQRTLTLGILLRR